MAGDKFLNPYNFIGFSEKKAKAYEDTDRHTGVIEYTITTKTPLFIPNSSSETAFKESETVADHKSYDFFSYTELEPGKHYENEYHLPVIPGSEIRGVVRNVYETLTDSCMGMLNEDEYPVKRSYERLVPGLLCRENGKIVLYKANSMRIGRERAEGGKHPGGFEDYRNGTEVSFRTGRGGWRNPVSQYSRDGRYERKGYLLKWGMGITDPEKDDKAKARYHVFELFVSKTGEYQKVKSFSRDEVERKLLNVVNSYLDQPAITEENRKAYTEYKEDLVNFLKNGKCFPVNYSVLDAENESLEQRIVYLAPATFSKEVYSNSIGKLAGQFAPCKENFCPACDLFGHIGKDNMTSRASAVRFTDLYVAEEKESEKYAEYYWRSKVTLQTLGGPKLGNVDFYLKRPEKAAFWTYDYYIANGNTQIRPGELRGRKFYWHHPQVRLEKAEPTKLNKTIRPVKEGVEFKGKLYFDSISERQMKQLVWILNSGSEQLGLQLGTAKPLGLGSISCTVDHVWERKINLTEDKLNYSVEELTYADLTYEAAKFSENLKVKEEFYKIAGLYTVPKNMQITYPRTYAQKESEMTEGFKWFGENHWVGRSGNGMIGRRKDVEILHELPGILDNEIGLPYDARKKKRNNTGYQGQNNRYNQRNKNYQGKRYGNNSSYKGTGKK